MEEAKSEPESPAAKVDYSSVANLRKPLSICDLGRECMGLEHAYGVDATKLGNMHFIEKKKIVYALSSAVVFQDIEIGHKSFLLGIDEGGVGCVAVHPSKKYMAVGNYTFRFIERSSAQPPSAIKYKARPICI
jgi:hypothetical protein